MATVANPFSAISRSSVEAAAEATRISMAKAEYAIAVQLEYAKCALKQVTLNARAAAQVKDVRELLALRSRIGESTIENLMGYSRSLYEVASEAQSEYSRLAEERMAAFQHAMSQTIDQAAKSAPAGSDVAVAAMKSQLAAATVAFDSFNKAARHMASFTDAGIAASRPAKTRK